MISKYNEFQILNEAILNEEFDINNIKSSIKSIADKNKVLKYLFNRFNNAKNQPMRKHIATLLITVFLINFGIRNNKWSNSNKLSAHEITKISNEMSYQETMSTEEMAQFLDIKIQLDEPKELKVPTYNNYELVDAGSLNVTSGTINFIKNHEKLRLKAYRIGDKRITIGWGHAEQIKTSRYKLGQEISIEEAENLFNKDLTIAENGVKRIFKQWKKSGLDIKITQNMFDAMVSMAYNMGVYGLRTSDFIQHIKNGDFQTAADSIKTTKVSKKFPGLETRREKEQELFTGQS